MRVSVLEEPGKADLVEELPSANPGFRAGTELGREHRLRNDIREPHSWIERRIWILEYDVRESTQRPELGRGPTQKGKSVRDGIEPLRGRCGTGLLVFGKLGARNVEKDLAVRGALGEVPHELPGRRVVLGDGLPGDYEDVAHVPAAPTSPQPAGGANGVWSRWPESSKYGPHLRPGQKTIVGSLARLFAPVSRRDRNNLGRSSGSVVPHLAHGEAREEGEGEGYPDGPAEG